jgi:hypothetical protein
VLQPAQRYREGNQSSQLLFVTNLKPYIMSQSFETLLLEVRDSIEQSMTPSQLTSTLMMALKKAEEFEEEWINELYENNDGFQSFIY